jgi:propionate catabolism operon transcriptional regulator
MARVGELARTYARGSAAVLLQGESGTGKEHIAREIHRLSDYADGELVAVNCGSIPNELFESEMFGYVDGAFTSARRGGRVGLLEQANGGLLFLDEVGEMPPAQQVKLLRVLQERLVRPVGGNREVAVDFKVIAATNADLAAAVARGDFRDDLYYRLNVLHLRLPPLRERPRISRPSRATTLTTTPASMGALMTRRWWSLREELRSYPWPGNVRELQNFMERLVVNMAGGADLNSGQAAAGAAGTLSAGARRASRCASGAGDAGNSRRDAAPQRRQDGGQPRTRYQHHDPVAKTPGHAEGTGLRGKRRRQR